MSWYTLPTSVPWLTLVLVVPLVGALLVALTPSVAGRVIKQLGIVTSVITLALVLAIIGGFQQGVGGLHLQFEETLRWIPSLGISYHLGIAGINFSQTGQLSFDWTVLVQHPVAGVWHLPGSLGSIGIPQLLFLGFALAFAIKMPIFPLHTWLPPAYMASPVPVVIVFAGLVSKLGAYGFLRFNLSLFPDAAHSLGGPLAVLATIGILYGAFMALAQTDLKRLVAYASMSHLGFIGLGIFAGNVLGIEGALVQMINHGVIIAALFLVVGMIERRAGTRLRAELRGLGATAPLFAALFLVVSLAALGLPGLNGFVGEFLIMLGAWASFLPLAVGAGIGVVLAAWDVL